MRARCGLGEGRNLSNGSPPIGGSIQNEDAKPDAKFYPPFPSPPPPITKTKKGWTSLLQNLEKAAP